MTTTTAATRRSTRPVRAIAMLLVALTASLMFGPTAVEASTARSSVFRCSVESGQRIVAASPPQMTSFSGGIENVYWRPVLFRWNGSSWQVYADNQPWHRAAANGSGVMYNSVQRTSWYHGTTNGNLVTARFGSLPAGHYLVADVFRWQNNRQAASWSNMGQFCTFS